jgi:dCTP deaminase
MILAVQNIRRNCELGMITPWCERTVIDGMSYGLSAASYDIRIAEDVIISPGDFKLASSLEHFKVPHDIVMIVHDKSSWARRGVAVQNTLFDPGWHGFATLEITNHGHEQIKIKAGWPIAQVVCHLLMEKTDQPYKGKYQNQEAGPQKARYE